MGRGALRGVLLRLAAGVACGTLRLEHLPPEILPAQKSARDLFIAAGKGGNLSTESSEKQKVMRGARAYTRSPTLGRDRMVGLDRDGAI